MNKDLIAENVNGKIKGIGREIKTNYELELVEGDIITVEKTESWSDGGYFTVENQNEYSYFFKCVNECPVHIVDYNNKEEVELLGAEDCEEEKEVLVKKGTKFRVVSEPNDVDYEEMGYYIVEVEYIG